MAPTDAVYYYQKGEELTEPYHKIVTVFKRDPATKYKTLIEDDWATPEIAYLAENQWDFTEKIDGTNIRVIWDKDTKQVTMHGRTYRSQLPAPLYHRLHTLFTTQEFVNHDMPSMTLYGEGYGKGIQKVGKLHLPYSVDFILFDIRVDDYWLKHEAVHSIASQLNVPMVPNLGHGTLQEAVDIVARGVTSALNYDMIAEGLVMRPVIQMFDRRGQRIITKIKYKDYPR